MKPQIHVRMICRVESGPAIYGAEYIWRGEYDGDHFANSMLKLYVPETGEEFEAWSSDFETCEVTEEE